MTDVYIKCWNQDETEQYLLETFDVTEIPTTFQFSNIQDLQKQHSSFAQSFKIPASKQNSDLFGPLFEVTATGSFNVKKKARAVIEMEGVPLIEGYLQLVQIVTRLGEIPEYVVRVFGETSSLLRDLGPKLLQELDLSTYDHVLSLANIAAGLSATGLSSGVIRYGIVDHGQGWTMDGLGGYEDLTDSNNPINAWEFTGWMRSKEILEKIFEEAGYQLVSTFKDSARFAKDFTMLHRRGRTPFYQAEDLAKAKAGISSDQAIGTGGSTIFTWNDESSFDFGDPNGNITGFQYFPPVDSLNGNDDGVNFGGGYIFHISLEITSTVDQQLEVFVEESGWHILNLQTGTHIYNIITAELFIDAGDDVSVFCFAPGTACTLVAGENTFLECVQGPINVDGATFVVADNFPEKVTCVEFIQALIKRYNMVIVPDREDPKKITLEPYTEWIDTEPEEDWTAKLDLAKAEVIDPTTSLESRTLLLTEKSGNDVLSKLALEQQGQPYGSKLLTNYDNDFTTKDEKIEAPSYCTPLNAIPGSLVHIPKLYNSDGNWTEGVLRFLQYGGNFDCDSYTYQDVDENTTAASNYPHFGHFDQPIPGSDAVDSNFGTQVPFHQITELPVGADLYSLYWKTYLEEIYSDTSRIYTAYFKLTLADIKRLKFNSLKRVRQSLYRINKVVDFRAGVEGEPTKVELILIQERNADRPCTLDVDTINSNTLQVTFTDGVSTGLTGSQLCCNANGYAWLNGACYLTNGLQGNVGPAVNSITPRGAYARTRFDAFRRGGTRGGVSAGVNAQQWVRNALVIGQGRLAQAMQLAMARDLDFDTGAATADQYLTLEGDATSHLQLPPDRHYFMRVDIVLLDEPSPGTYNNTTITATAVVGSSGGVHYVKADYSSNVAAQGDRSANAGLVIDNGASSGVIRIRPTMSVTVSGTTRAAANISLLEIKKPA